MAQAPLHYSEADPAYSPIAERMHRQVKEQFPIGRWVCCDVKTGEYIADGETQAEVYRNIGRYCREKKLKPKALYVFQAGKETHRPTAEVMAVNVRP